MKLEYEKKSEEFKKGKQGESNGSQAKLPKLSITKFDGTFEQWLPFWNKFCAEIDSTDLPPVTKFAYLKELIQPKVRADIDGLPFSTEGYERAKNILKSEYGKTSEIINAYVTNIMGLPTILGGNPQEVDMFYKKLLYNVQSLETLGKLREVSGNVRAVLDKLRGIKADLVRGQDGWQEWDFSQLLQAIKRWKDINPVTEESENRTLPNRKNDRHDGNFRRRSYQTQQESGRQMRGCVYCDKVDHISANCPKVVAVEDRRRILSRKQLCFNCTGDKHRAESCRSHACQKCQRRHHTSICDQATQTTNGRFLTAQDKSSPGQVIYPVVLVDVNGFKCRALLDTGAGSSYASSAILDHLGLRPVRKEFKRIEMMLGSVNKVIGVYNVTIKSLNGKFRLETKVTKVDRGTLLSLDNPKYAEVINKYPHLTGVRMIDGDKKAELPVHIILGVSDYAKIRTETRPKIGQPGEPVAELTQFGWTIMSPGKEIDISSMLLTQTATADYEELCKLDVLGIQDKGHQTDVYDEFKEQLNRNVEGWYETGLPWKANHPSLPNNKAGSLRRLDSTIRKLEKQELFEQYDAIIRDQLAEGIVEPAGEHVVGREFYIPHKPVVRETAESTKLRIVYDASARAHDNAPSLNDCLHAGPPLQNQLWAVLLRARFHPVLITGDMKQAFLQVRIREQDRDAMRFHWVADRETRRAETLRFTRALFGLSSSPFLLGGVIRQHLENCRATYPEIVSEIEKSLYVDDLINGGPTVGAALQVKETSTEIFAQGGFTLHKWHSNASELDAVSTNQTGETQETYAKQQLGVPQRGKGSLLGVSWDMEKDTLEVKFPAERAQPTKRSLLGKLSRVYDPLGLVSPTTLSGKLLYREACELKIPWDTQLPDGLIKELSKWEEGLPADITVPRPLTAHRENITKIDLHCFGDASGRGVSAALYAVVTQPSGVSVGLVTAKARLAKQGLSIPRLELVSGHMATNLITNTRDALEGFPVSELHCWLDSTVALHWIRGAGDYKQFVGNRVSKIQQHSDVKWRHVTSQENPADLGSRGGRVQGADLWWKGPRWLAERENWPHDIVTSVTPESQAEAKVSKEVFGGARNVTDGFDVLLEKFALWKTLRVCTWIQRFVCNSRKRKEERSVGPLTTEEIEKQKYFWTARAQNSGKRSEKFDDDKLQLNLQERSDGLLECRGRIQGDYPIYLPDTHPYTEKLVMLSHLVALHGGVGLTMTKVREHHWVPRLRRLAKKVIKSCFGCKRFQATALTNPPPGSLPSDRTEGTAAFQVVGVDFAGPMKYRKGKKNEGKAYIVLYACSLTRGIYLELLPSLETEEFMSSLKRFIARRGRPNTFYSDNGRTFVGAAKLLKTIMADEKLQDYLAHLGIRWKFNLSRAPWWGGQFERLIGLVKRALHKQIGCGMLTWGELQDVLLDIEVALNNRPLSYVEDDPQLPVLTPNSLLFGQPNLLPEMEHHHLETPDLRKRAKYIKRCKDVLWKRWTDEYLKSLREQHRLNHPVKSPTIAVGDVMLIKEDERNRGKWKMGIVEELITGRDGVVRGAKLRAGKSHLERAIQHLYPLELTCDRQTKEPGNELNPDAAEFAPQRETRCAARDARERLAAIAENERDF